LYVTLSKHGGPLLQIVRKVGIIEERNQKESKDGEKETEVNTGKKKEMQELIRKINKEKS
jgi:hypothetical protein